MKNPLCNSFVWNQSETIIFTFFFFVESNFKLQFMKSDNVVIKKMRATFFVSTDKHGGGARTLTNQVILVAFFVFYQRRFI